MRSQELNRQKTPAYEKELEELKQKREKCAHTLNRLEDMFNFSCIKNELDQIRRKEIEKGEKKVKNENILRKILLNIKEK